MITSPLTKRKSDQKYGFVEYFSALIPCLNIGKWALLRWPCFAEIMRVRDHQPCTQKAERDLTNTSQGPRPLHQLPSNLAMGPHAPRLPPAASQPTQQEH